MDEDKQSQDNKNNKKMCPDVLKWIIIGLAGVGVIVLIFGAGIFVGGMKARFSYRWAENYHKNFAGPREGFMNNLGDFPVGDFIEAHGSFGKIIKIDGKIIIIQGRENIEKTILIKDDTVVKGIRGDIKPTDLKVDDFITVIGSPNDSGQIEAKLIRILPPPPMSAMPPFNKFNN